MARRAVVERDELFQAADALASAGRPVTALELHRVLGGGSLTTVYKYLAEWEAARPKALPAGSASEMPESIKGVFAAAWRTAMVEAAKDTEAIKQKAAEEIAAANKRFEGALEAIAKLESEREQEVQEIEDLKRKLASAQQELSEAQSERAAKAATAEQLQNQLVVRTQEAQKAHERSDRLEREREDAIKQSAQLAGQLQALTAQNKDLVEALKAKK